MASRGFRRVVQSVPLALRDGNGQVQRPASAPSPHPPRLEAPRRRGSSGRSSGDDPAAAATLRAAVGSAATALATTTFKTSNFSLASQTTLPPTGTLGIWFVSFAVLAFCPRNRTLLLAAHVGNVLVHAAKIPFVWDYEYWDLLVELAVIFYGGSVDDAAPVARAQMLLFYYATAFYKFTTSFLSRAVSCGPIFVLALLDLVTPAAFSISPEALTVLTALSPPTTILVELAVPTLLLLKPKFGILLGLLFHLLITLQPPPSNAGGFSVSVAVRYAFFVGGFF
mmetsp:Transcript_24784/g.80157  ORF Transcript_24784/g.80157 Transcript_24784/m.80157 type:complete len:282 (+) Transcript_24784:246-1091(+)